MGNIGDWGAGATPSRTHPEYYGGNIPWLKTGDLTDSYIDAIPETITELALEKTSVRLNPAGSVLIAMYGATIGKLGILSIAATTNQACCACFPLGGLDNKYLFYFLMAQKPLFIKQGEGGAQPNISKEKIVSTLMPVPPLEEQRRIVVMLGRIFPIIDVYSKCKTELDLCNTTFPERLKKSILQEAVQGKLVPQDPSDEPAEALLERIRAEKQRLIKEGKIKKGKHESVIFRRDNSHYEKLDGVEHCIDEELPFEIPESWAWVRLGTILSVSSGDSLTGAQMNSAGSIPVYGGNGIAGTHDKWNVCHRTLVIGRVGYYCGATHITESFAWVTDNAFITHFNEELLQMKWLKFLIDYLEPRKRASSTAQPVISGKLLYPMLVPLPPLAEQHRIVQRVDELLPLVKGL